jgi:peroxiredoxin
VRVVAISPDPPSALRRLRRDLHLDFPLVSDAGERSVAVFCGGLAHCFVLLDAAGTVRWAGASERWSHVPPLETLLQAAYRMDRPR